MGVPVFAGWLWARFLSGQLSGMTPRWVSLAIVLVAAIIVSLLVSRLTNRLMPLAVLLKMTMIFPDRAPSRLKVARRTTSLSDIKTRLASPRLDEQDAAATMLALVTALGRHDRHTRGHSERVRLFCDLLSRELKLSNADSGRLRWAALIHDIGKLQVPATVLNKPGKLNEREWDLIRLHPDAGARLAQPLAQWLGPWFSGIAEHHERYDGQGYPRGLSATAISPAGRAIAVVDAFETMTAARSYKAARSTLAARAELTRCAGSHFDPAMVRAFLAIALPRLLWSVGPLAFLVNAPFLHWLGEGSVRVGNAVGATTAGAANVAAVGAVAVAVGTSQSVAATAAPALHQPRVTSSATASISQSADGNRSAGPQVPSHDRPAAKPSKPHASPAKKAAPAKAPATKTSPASAKAPGHHSPKPTKPAKPTKPKKVKKAKPVTKPKGGAKPPVAAPAHHKRKGHWIWPPWLFPKK